MIERKSILTRILNDSLNVGPKKSVSYLPIKTIERVLGISVSAYCSMIEAAGNRAVILSPDACCIESGAVYAFSPDDLKAVLIANREVLETYGWPESPEAFVKRMAQDWVDESDEIIHVIRAAFNAPSRL